MLKKLENQTFMTVREICAMYPDNWFRYGVDEAGLIKALYIADTQDDLLNISAEDMINAGYRNWGDIYPINSFPEKPIEIGDLDIVEWPE